MRVCIIGGGASGMIAAIIAYRNGHDVTILEHMNRLGKKILATGNGKCNLTNRNLDLHIDTINSFYSSSAKEEVKDELLDSVFKFFGYKETIEFFNGIGLKIRNRDDYIYPYSEQASAVLDVLRLSIDELSISVITECSIQKITKSKQFTIITDKGKMQFDRVIIACGSKAQPKLGSDGSGYSFAKSLGHKIVKPLPSLVQIRCKEKFFKSIAGVRVKGIVKAQVIDNSLKKASQNILLAADEGEIQITDYGVSGIPVMNISGAVAKAIDCSKKVWISIDMMPGMSKKELADMLMERKAKLAGRNGSDFLTGLINKNLSALFLKISNIDGNIKIKDIDDSKLYNLTELINNFRLEVSGVNSFDNAQVCSGGVEINEINLNMSSKLVKGLYFAGEILDIDGRCGGYNLQWAWSSGAVAAMNL